MKIRPISFRFPKSEIGNASLLPFYFLLRPLRWQRRSSLVTAERRVRASVYAVTCHFLSLVTYVNPLPIPAQCEVLYGCRSRCSHPVSLS